jgi:HlyD family secretion protein
MLLIVAPTYHDFMMNAPAKNRLLGTSQILKILALTGLVTVSWFALQWGWLGPEVSVVSIEKQDFVQTVVASGRVESPHRIDVGSQMTGTVQKVPVTEGQTVQSGQVLIELESSELEASLQQANANVLQAQAKMRQLKEVQAPVASQAYQQALINQENNQSALKRTQELFNQGFVGRSALDEFKKLSALSSSQVLSLTDQLKSFNQDGSEFALAQASLLMAQSGVDLARSRLHYARILAPVSGTLIARSVETGDVVQPGKILMVLSPRGATELVVQIDEKHFRQLKVGQVARASADAFGNEQFKAILSFINPGVDAQRGSVTVKFKVPTPPAYLQQDMTVSLNIEVAERQQVLMVPTGAIHDIEKKAWVQKVVNKRVVRQDIQMGLRGSGYSEVIKGLAAGDIIVREASVLNENARIRAHRVSEKS